ncbi:MAG: response regulator transcription factor [Planctomycetes bacterium]|nr:response regulator transcription factor [Planctomycetota bacterium]
MNKSPNPPIENVAGSDFLGRDHEIILLNKKEWLYVKKRYNLTPRECQIAELICQGLLNGKIAKYLRISPGTVKTHTRNIYRKARVKSKIAMLLRFVTDARAISSQYDQTHFTAISD